MNIKDTEELENEIINANSETDFKKFLEENEENFPDFTLAEYLNFLLTEKKLDKTEIVKTIKFDSSMKIAEDFKFLIEYIEKMNGSGIVIEETNYNYYIRKGSAIHSEFNNNWFHEIEFCRSLVNKYKGTEFEIYAIKRFVRINLSCASNFKIDRKTLKTIKKNIKPYQKQMLKSNLFNKKEKIKLILIINVYFIVRLQIKIKERKRLI